MRKVNLQIAIWKEGKHFVAQCLNVDISSFGRTQKSALANIREALELYLEDTQTNKVTKVTNPVIRSALLQYA